MDVKFKVVRHILQNLVTLPLAIRYLLSIYVTPAWYLQRLDGSVKNLHMENKCSFPSLCP